MLAPPRLGHCSNAHELTRASASPKLVAGDALAKPSPWLDAGEHQLPVAALRVANGALWANPAARRRVWPRRRLNAGELTPLTPFDHGWAQFDPLGH